MIKNENKIFTEISPATYREDIISFINYVELKYSPEHLTMEGLHIWPLLRRIIASEKENLVLGFRLFPTSEKGNSYQILANDLKESFQKRQKEVAPHTSTSESYNLIEVDEQAVPEALLKSDILFYSRPSRYLERSARGKLINSDIDHEFTLFGKIAKSAKIELGHKKTYATSTREHLTYIIRNSHNPRIKVNWLGSTIERNNYNTFRDQVIAGEAVPASILPKLEKLARLVTDIKRKKKIFVNVLKKIKPKAVAVSLYYDSNEGTMSLIWACKELGIPTFELQHGLIGSHHWAFTHWSALPNVSYEMMPDYFWVWDKFTENVINESNARSAHSPQPIVAKNIKSYSLRMADNTTTMTRPKLHLNLITKGYKKTILFSQQYGLGMTPEVILDVIKNSPDNWLWLIRLHPLARPLAEAWRLLLDEAQIVNYEIEFSNLISISDTFDLVNHVVTSFSTTAFEATAEGIPCTIISNIGFESYQPYIEAGIVDFALTTEKIIESIQEAQIPKKIPIVPNSLAEVNSTLDKMYKKYYANSDERE